MKFKKKYAYDAMIKALYLELQGLIDNLKELLELYNQTKDAYDLVEGVREIVEDYE
jgi:hypothetical protein